MYGIYILLASYAAKDNPPTRPDHDFRKSPERCIQRHVCGDEDSALYMYCCRVEKYDSAWRISQGARLTFRDLRSGGARVVHHVSRLFKLFAIADSAL